MLLIDAEHGQLLTIQGFLSGKGLEDKLRQLGVIPGDKAKIVRKAPFDGPLLLTINGREIALGKGIASKILVEVLPCDSQ